MKLLIDENLSRRLAKDLQDLFPGSIHLSDLGLEHAPDDAVWEAAKAGGSVIVSKDEDFHQRSFLYGWPPKVIWVRLGNCSTATILRRIRQRSADIEAFARDSEASFLALG